MEKDREIHQNQKQQKNKLYPIFYYKILHVVSLIFCENRQIYFNILHPQGLSQTNLRKLKTNQPQGALRKNKYRHPAWKEYRQNEVKAVSVTTAEPLAEAAEDFSEAAEPLAVAAEGFSGAAEPLAEAAEDFSEAAEPLAEATEGFSGAAEPLAEATEGFSGAAECLAAVAESCFVFHTRRVCRSRPCESERLTNSRDTLPGEKL